jgi:tryptophanase
VNKSDRISALVSGLRAAGGGIDPCYEAFFKCFNDQRYYEAHDVLEHLWLKCHDETARYFKGLIQAAGAFVHLQKQFSRPAHPKDGKRLRPAVRLFRLALENLAPYRPRHLGFEVESLCRLCEKAASEIVGADFRRNPWHPEHAPKIFLSGTA